jgi:hypothetical protein
MRLIGTIEVNAAGAWSVRVSDRFLPSGTHDLFIGDAPHDPSPMLSEEDAAAVERESAPPAWWLKLTERWRRNRRNTER